MSHPLNPFDFVPFAKEPLLKTTAGWLNDGSLQTGYLDLQITARTPLHIVGRQETVEKKGQQITKSHFYRRNSKAYIPGATIRGLLRAFVEAACNGWASQMTPFYSVKPGKRQVGFLAVDTPDEELEKAVVDKTLQFALPPAYVAQPKSNGPIDLASFLFGYIPKDGEGWRGLITIEDAPAEAASWDEGGEKFQLPDIKGEAFMGGPNPSARTWWYHQPQAIRKRKIRRPGSSDTMTVLDFLGNGFRGRKFYYHQDPKLCLPQYAGPDWNSPYRFDLECLPRGAKTGLFRLYFEQLPLKLVYLLAWALAPHPLMRHKLGYGKAYGYGSISISIADCRFRKSSLPEAQAVPPETADEIKNLAWNVSVLKAKGLDDFVDMGSLEKLFPILHYPDDKTPLSLVFRYPKFSEEGFLPVIMTRDLDAALQEANIRKSFNNDLLQVTPPEAEKIAEALRQQGLKPALHFEVYQKNADDYETVRSRKLED